HNATLVYGNCPILDESQIAQPITTLRPIVIRNSAKLVGGMDEQVYRLHGGFLLCISILTVPGKGQPNLLSPKPFAPCLALCRRYELLTLPPPAANVPEREPPAA